MEISTEFIYGTVITDSALEYECMDENLRSLFGVKETKFTEHIAPDDLPAYETAVRNVAAGETKREELYVHLDTCDGKGRFYLITVQKHKRQFASVRVTDIEHAAENCEKIESESERLAQIFQLNGDTLFEYFFATDSISIFQFYGDRRRELSDTPLYAELGRHILTDIRLVSSSATSYSFVKDYFFSDNGFHINGKIILKNGAMSSLVGTIAAFEGSAVTSQISPISSHDGPTGLFNKSYALSMARQAFESKMHPNISIVIMDIDNFKSINDTYGHIFGDEVIKKLAIIIREASISRGFAARFGGDEFFIVLYDIFGEAELRAILQGIKFHFQNSFPEKDHHFSVSIGVAEFPRNGGTFDEIMRKADKALYIAKFKGKDRYIIYKEELHGELDENEAKAPVEGILVTEIDQRAAQVATITRCTLEAVKLKRSDIDFDSKLGFIFEKIFAAYKAEGVSFYKAPDFKPVYRFGSYTNPPEDAKFITHPGALDIFHGSRIHEAAIQYCTLGRASMDDYRGYLKAHNIYSTLQILIGDKDDINDVRMLVAYDREHDTGNNSAEARQDLLVFSNIICSLFFE